MIMEIHGYCKYDYEAVRGLALVSFFKKRRPGVCLTVYIVCFVIVSFLHVFSYYIFGDKALTNLWYFMLGLFIYVLWRYSISPRRNYNAMKKLKDIENWFIFTADKMILSSSKDGCTGSYTFNYNMIVEVYETSRYFFIGQDRRHAFVVDKHSMSAEDALEIRSRLSSYLPKKYNICKY